MNKVLNILASIIICQITFGQSKTDKITSKIIEEGKMLYKSEMASWYGTDIFIEKFKEKEKIGGYLSYSALNVCNIIFNIMLWVGLYFLFTALFSSNSIFVNLIGVTCGVVFSTILIDEFIVDKDE